MEHEIRVGNVYLAKGSNKLFQVLEIVDNRYLWEWTDWTDYNSRDVFPCPTLESLRAGLSRGEYQFHEHRSREFVPCVDCRALCNQGCKRPRQK